MIVDCPPEDPKLITRFQNEYMCCVVPENDKRTCETGQIFLQEAQKYQHKLFLCVKISQFRIFSKEHFLQAEGCICRFSGGIIAWYECHPSKQMIANQIDILENADLSFIRLSTESVSKESIHLSTHSLEQVEKQNVLRTFSLRGPFRNKIRNPNKLVPLTPQVPKKNLEINRSRLASFSNAIMKHTPNRKLNTSTSVSRNNSLKSSFPLEQVSETPPNVQMIKYVSVATQTERSYILKNKSLILNSIRLSRDLETVDINHSNNDIQWYRCTLKPKSKENSSPLRVISKLTLIKKQY